MALLPINLAKILALALIFAKSKPLQIQGIELVKSIVLINMLNIFSPEDLIPGLTEARIVNVVFITLFVYISMHNYFQNDSELNVYELNTLTMGIISVKDEIAKDETLLFESDKSLE